MNKRNSTLSIAAVLAASVLALQAPIAGAQSSSGQQGVPGVEVNVGDNASDRGLPGVEMNVGRDGDQNNVDIGRNGDQNNVDTRALGAGADTTGTLGAGTGTSGMNADGSTSLPMRADRN